MSFFFPSIEGGGKWRSLSSPSKIFSSTPGKQFWKLIRELQNFRSNKTQIPVVSLSTEFISAEHGLGCFSDPLHLSDIPVQCAACWLVLSARSVADVSGQSFQLIYSSYTIFLHLLLQQRHSMPGEFPYLLPHSFSRNHLCPVMAQKIKAWRHLPLFSPLLMGQKQRLIDRKCVSTLQSVKEIHWN